MTYTCISKAIAVGIFVRIDYLLCLHKTLIVSPKILTQFSYWKRNMFKQLFLKLVVDELPQPFYLYRLVQILEFFHSIYELHYQMQISASLLLKRAQ